MIKLNKAIDHLIDSVPENMTRRFNCPVCRGNNTLTVSRLGMQIHYNCFRASCSLRGMKRCVPSMNALRSHRNDVFRREEEFQVPTYWIKGIASKKCLSFLFKTNGLDGYSKGLFSVGYDPEQDRLVYFIKENGKVVGAVGRSLSGKTPKTYNYPNSKPVPFMVGTGRTLVLVEDCASACAIGSLPKFTGLALLGTNIKDEYIPYIKSYDSVIVCLDYDARDKSIELKKDLKIYHNDVRLWILMKDFKDMSKEELLRVS